MIKSFIKYTVALSLFITSTVSFAQAALEEMVVTSQKREQNLLDVPSALQAFSGDMLEGAGVRDTNDLTNLVPDVGSIYGSLEVKINNSQRNHCVP